MTRRLRRLGRRHEGQILQDTETLYIGFDAGKIAETRDLDENALLELDEQGCVCAMTMEHVSLRTDISGLSYEQAVT